MTHEERAKQIIAEARKAAANSGSINTPAFQIGWIASRLADAEERIEALTPALLRKQAG